MPVGATTETSQTLDVGDVWEIGVACTDADGDFTAATITVQVTTPTGAVTAPTAVDDGATGYYLAQHTITEAGRHLAVVTASGTVVGVVPFTAWAQNPTPADGMPNAGDALTYLNSMGETSATDADIADALTAEAAAQRARCRIPAVYPPDLRQALLRRVARNLAARSVPIATFTSFEGGGTSSRVPSLDAEVARFEGPYRRRVVG